MGLEVSIENVFRRAMESDLELIAQNVSAQTSSNTTPQGSCMCACNISATVVFSNEERLEEQLYSVKQIVFQPVESFAGIMDHRRQEASGQPGVHGPHLDTLGTLLTKGPTLKGDRKLLAQNQVLSLLGALARHYQDEGPNVTIVVRPGSKVITMGVVDYVAVADLTKDEIKNLVHTNQLRIAEIPAIERWPEEVIIGEETYQRADLAFTTPSAKVSAKREIPRNGHTWTLEQVVEETAQRTGGRGRKSLHSPGSLHKT